MKIIDLDRDEAVVLLKHEGTSYSFTKAQLIDLMERSGLTSASRKSMASIGSDHQLSGSDTNVKSSDSLSLAALGKRVSLILETVRETNRLEPDQAEVLIEAMQRFDGQFKPRASSKVWSYLNEILQVKPHPEIERQLQKFLASYPQLKAISER